MTISREAALAAFTTAAASWQNASLALIASGAVALVIGVHGEGDKDYQATMTALREIVAGKGVRQSMSYRYTSLARDLVTRFEKDGTDKGVIAEILSARKPETAAKVVTDFLASNKVNSLGTLATLLGGPYQPKALGRKPRVSEAQPEATGVILAQRPQTPHDLAAAVVATRKPVAVVREIIEEISDVEILNDILAAVNDRIATLSNDGATARKRPGRRSTAVEHAAA